MWQIIVDAYGYDEDTHLFFRTILEFKAEKILKKIDQNLQKADELIAAAKDNRVTLGEFSKRYFNLNLQWKQLNDELRSIESKQSEEG